MFLFFSFYANFTFRVCVQHSGSHRLLTVKGLCTYLHISNGHNDDRICNRANAWKSVGNCSALDFGISNKFAGGGSPSLSASQVVWGVVGVFVKWETVAPHLVGECLSELKRSSFSRKPHFRLILWIDSNFTGQFCDSVHNSMVAKIIRSHIYIYTSPSLANWTTVASLPQPLLLRSLSTSHTECLHQQSVSLPLLQKLACACHSHNGCGINTFIPILAALPLCPPAPKNGTACKTQPLCQLITALLLQSFVPHRLARAGVPAPRS